MKFKIFEKKISGVAGFNLRLNFVNLIFIFMLFVGLSSTSFAETKEKYIFLAPIYDISGTGVDTKALKDMGEKLKGTFEKKVGTSFEYQLIGSEKMDVGDSMELIVEKLKSGVGDFTYLQYDSYIKAKEAKIPIKPLLIVSLKGTTKPNCCVYIKQGSPFKSIKDLKNGRTTIAIEWYPFRWLLYEQGIDMPPEKFLGEILPISSLLSTFYALTLNQIDFFTLPEPIYFLIKKTDEKFKNVVPLVCTNKFPEFPFPVYREGVDKNIIDKMKEVLKNSHKDPAFGALRVYAQTMGMKLLDFKEEELKDFEKIYEFAKAKGWEKEYTNWTNALKKLKKAATSATK